jgi:filamentous hemagglutinin
MAFTPSQPLPALQSIAADILNTWTVPNQPYPTKGGGTQYFVPNKSLMNQVPKL